MRVPVVLATKDCGSFWDTYNVVFLLVQIESSGGYVDIPYVDDSDDKLLHFR